MTTAQTETTGGGYFPRWKEKTSGVIAPEERLPWGQTIISGLQHSIAMSGATIVAPLIMGFDPSLALFFSGIGTLIHISDRLLTHPPAACGGHSQVRKFGEAMQAP